MIAKIKNLKKFNKLVFFIPTIDIDLAILKTIVFVNSFNKEVILINHLNNLLSIYIKNDKKRLI